MRRFAHTLLNVGTAASLLVLLLAIVRVAQGEQRVVWYWWRNGDARVEIATPALWTALTATILPCVWLAVPDREEVPPKGHGRRRCARCGYDLRATPTRCPECGTTTHPTPGSELQRRPGCLP